MSSRCATTWHRAKPSNQRTLSYAVFCGRARTSKRPCRTNLSNWPHRRSPRCAPARMSTVPCQHGRMLSPLAVLGPAPAPRYARPHIRWGSVSTFNRANAIGLIANTTIAALRAGPLLTGKSRARPLAPQDPPKTDPSPPYICKLLLNTVNSLT